MRKFLLALSLAGAVAAPALAASLNEDLADVELRWAPIAPQSAWRKDVTSADLQPSAMGPFAASGRYGVGWSLLDGWMRGDPVLRSWVVARFDVNGDTWLSSTEAAIARQTFYDMADVNGSGRITSEEFVIGWIQVRGESRRGYTVAAG